ncbi:MAG: hypothetical protein ABI461_23680, partial [Polyangiaceae bacterium]
MSPLRCAAGVVLALGVTGCGTTTRDVTPWLETRTHTGVEIIAESGNNRSGNWLRVRRKIDGEWQPVAVQSDYAFPLANGTRAVL